MNCLDCIWKSLTYDRLIKMSNRLDKKFVKKLACAKADTKIRDKDILFLLVSIPPGACTINVLRS